MVEGCPWSSSSCTGDRLAFRSEKRGATPDLVEGAQPAWAAVVVKSIPSSERTANRPLHEGRKVFARYIFLALRFVEDEISDW